MLIFPNIFYVLQAKKQASIKWLVAKALPQLRKDSIHLTPFRESKKVSLSCAIEIKSYKYMYCISVGIEERSVSVLYTSSSAEYFFPHSGTKNGNGNMRNYCESMPFLPSTYIQFKKPA
jgi:hypothetical protein